jgi:hypothetical protein
MIRYCPYKSDKPNKNYFIIITSNDKKVYFGQAGASDFTRHKDEARKQRYINSHKKNENRTKSGIDTAGWWSYYLLWNLPTIRDSYNDIKKKIQCIIYI